MFLNQSASTKKVLLFSFLVFIVGLVLGCAYRKTFVFCGTNNIECIQRQLPEGARIVGIDSTSSMERGVYIVKFR